MSRDLVAISYFMILGFSFPFFFQVPFFCRRHACQIVARAWQTIKHMEKLTHKNWSLVFYNVKILKPAKQKQIPGFFFSISLWQGNKCLMASSALHRIEMLWASFQKGPQKGSSCTIFLSFGSSQTSLGVLLKIIGLTKIGK